MILGVIVRVSVALIASESEPPEVSMGPDVIDGRNARGRQREAGNSDRGGIRAVTAFEIAGFLVVEPGDPQSDDVLDHRNVHLHPFRLS
jgi:hypothetical protein